MASSPLVYLEKEDGIVTMFLNRAEKRNALNLEMWQTITRLMREVEEDPDVKVVIVRGVNETAFCAGADISEFEERRLDYDDASYYNQQIELAETALMKCKVPTIAMIHGFCIGGGCEIALACDMRFAASNGLFGITAAKIGTIYGLTATRNLIHVVGPAKAKDILFTGRLIDAEEAFRIGLIDRLYPVEELERQTYEYARMIAERAPLSVKSSKRIIYEILRGEDHNPDWYEELVVATTRSRDYQEGIRAFLEKRKPQFQGR